MTTVLIVDDSKFSRGRVIAALSPLGYRSVEAGDGQAGLNAVESDPPDVIVTDLLMPTLDGFGLLRGLRERGSQIPVVVVSADIQASSRQLCEELGVVTFLNKPFHSHELAAKVQEALQTATVVH